MVVRAVQVLVQLDHQRLEEGGELPLGLGRVHLLVLVHDPPLHPELPGGRRGDPGGLVGWQPVAAAARAVAVGVAGGEGGVGDEDAELALLLHGSLEGLLDVKPLAHDGGVKLALKGQQVHVSLIKERKGSFHRAKRDVHKSLT